MNVLLIEDDTFQATLIGSMLKTHPDAVVTTAHSGLEALHIVTCSEKKPDLVVCDLSMPEMDGLEMLYHFSKIIPNASYAILSAAEDDVLQSAYHTANAYGINNMEIYSKPLTVDQAKTMLSVKSMPCSHKTGSSDVKPSFSKEDILHAITNNEFELHYQPQVASQTSELIGAEALIRWNHPSKGLLSPYFFLEDAMNMGLGNVITQWVIKQAIADIVLFRQHGIYKTVSVNVNASDVSERSFTNVLLSMMVTNRLPAECINIEVTETEFTPDANSMLETLTRLRLAGFGVSIDDFGTGYSSLYQLTMAPFTELKIDRSFVEQIQTSNKHFKSVKAIATLCKELGVKTVVEGVETQEQQAVLQQLGTDYFQGYFFSKPLHKIDYIQWAEDQSELINQQQKQSA